METTRFPKKNTMAN